MTRPQLLAVAGLALLGLALRLGYVLAVAGHPHGLGDAAEFHGLANVLADGRGFVNPFSPTAHAAPTAHKPPLYPVALAGVSLLGGRSWTAHQVASAFIGTGTVLAVAGVAREAAGGRAAVWAAALAAVFPAFVARDGSVHGETLFSLLVALALLAALRVARRPSPARLGLLGASIGLAALTRSEGIVLLVLLAVPAVWRAGPDRLRHLAVVVGVAAVVLAPWLVRCWATFDRPVALTTSTGDLLAGANCDATYRGSLIGEWAFTCVLGAPGSDEADIAGRLRARGVRYARTHAGRLPSVAVARALRPWGLFHPDQEVRLQATAGGGPRWLGWSGLAALWLLLPLAVVGAVRLRRIRRDALLLLLAPVGLVVLQTVTGYGILRFRAAADVTLVVLAGVALATVGARRRRRAPLP